MSDRVEKLLQDIRLLDDDRHRLVQDLRAMILGVAPGITEEVKYGGLLYSAAVPVCGVFSYAKHVSVEFGQGSSMADPHGVLEGSGKFRRHIKLVSANDVTGKHLREYVAIAFAEALGVPAGSA